MKVSFFPICKTSCDGSEESVQLCLSGAIGRISERQSMDCQRTTLHVEGQMFVGSVKTIKVPSSESRVEFQHSTDTEDVEFFQNTLGGMSGSGLWEFQLVRAPSEKIECEFVYLKGIGYFQTDPTENGSTVICHTSADIKNFLSKITPKTGAIQIG